MLFTFGRGTSTAIWAYNFIIEDVHTRLVRFLVQPKKNICKNLKNIDLAG